MIVNEISLVIQNKNDIRKLMADKKTKESSKEIKIRNNNLMLDQGYAKLIEMEVQKSIRNGIRYTIKYQAVK